MPFSTPTLNDLVRIAENGLSSEFYGEESVLRKSVLKVIARVFAGIAFLAVLLLQKMWKNNFLETCDVETLKDKGVDYDLPNKPEGYARGSVVVKKSVASDVSLPQGTILTNDSGIEFEVDASYVMSGAENSLFSVNVIAVRSGSDSNLSASATLYFSDGTPEGLDENVYVDSYGVSGGIKKEVVVNSNTEYWGETVEEYRQRLKEYRRTQPHGGCGADYKSWAKRFACVSECIVQENYPNTNSVTCVLAFYGEGSESIELNPANVSEVRDYIQSQVRRPVTADVRVESCRAKSVNLGVGISPNNVNVQQSVRTALKKIFQSYAPGDTVNASDLSSDLKASSIADVVVVYSVDSGTSVVLSKENHELPVIGSVAWSDV